MPGVRITVRGFALLSCLVVQTAHAAILHDPLRRRVTMTARDLVLVFDYRDRAALTSLRVSGVEKLASGQPAGISYLQCSDGSVVSSESLTSPPVVSVGSAGLTARFAMGNDAVSVAETWTFHVDPDGITQRTDRTYHWRTADHAVRSMGQPRLRWAVNAWDTVRKPEDGGSIPVWGDALRRAARVRLQNGKPAFPTGLALETGGNRYGIEQGSFVLLKRAWRPGTGDALAVAAAAPEYIATEVWRAGTVDEPGSLVTDWQLSQGPWRYANGNPKGYAGHFCTDGRPIFAAKSVADGHTDSVTLRYAAGEWASYYDIGRPAGLNAELLSGLINDFGRAMMQDKSIGGSSERSFRVAQAPPFTSLWNVYAAELLQDRAAFASFRAQMKDIRDGLQQPDGFVRCCFPFLTLPHVPQAYDVTDNVFAYPLAIAELDELAPDAAWLKDIRPAAEVALDYALRHLLIGSGPQAGLFSNYQCGQPAPDCDCARPLSEWNDNYDIGQVSAYHNVLAYAALQRWADLETSVFGDRTRSDRYARTAAALKAAYNRDGEHGGFWSPATGAFAYTRDARGLLAKDCYHLFPNGYALMYGVVDGPRRAALARNLKAQYDIRQRQDGWRLHGSNPLNCKTTETAGMYFPFFENGGVHLLMEQPAAQIGLVLGDRHYNVGFARTVIQRYGRDGFWGMSHIQPDTLEVRRDTYQEAWMSNNVLGVWPLYHDIFGFQPRRDRLDLVPFIDESLIGSQIHYLWRGTIPVTVAYPALETYRVTYDGSQPVRIGWRGCAPGQSYTILEDGRARSARADADGLLWYQYRQRGTHAFALQRSAPQARNVFENS